MGSQSQGVVVAPGRVFCTTKRHHYPLPSLSRVIEGQWVEVEWAGQDVVRCQPSSSDIPAISVKDGRVKVRTCVVLPSEAEAATVPDGLALAWSPLLGRVCVDSSFGQRFDSESCKTNVVYEQSVVWNPDLNPNVSCWAIEEQPIHPTQEDYNRTMRGAPWVPMMPPSLLQTTSASPSVTSPGLALSVQIAGGGGRMSVEQSIGEYEDQYEDLEVEEWHEYVGCVIGEQQGGHRLVWAGQSHAYLAVVIGVHGGNRFLWAAGRDCVLYSSEHPKGLPDLGDVIRVKLRMLNNRLDKGTDSEWKVVDWQRTEAPGDMFGEIRVNRQYETVVVCVRLLVAHREEWVDGVRLSVYSHPFFGHIVDDKNIIPPYTSTAASVEIRRKKVGERKFWKILRYLAEAYGADTLVEGAVELKAPPAAPTQTTRCDWMLRNDETANTNSTNPPAVSIDWPPLQTGEGSVRVEEWHEYLGCVIGVSGGSCFVWAAGRNCFLCGNEHRAGVPELGTTVIVNIKEDVAGTDNCEARVVAWKYAERRTGEQAFGELRPNYEFNTASVCTRLVNRRREEWMRDERVFIYSHPFFGDIVDDQLIITSTLPAIHIEIRRRKANGFKYWRVHSCFRDGGVVSGVDTATSFPLNVERPMAETAAGGGGSKGYKPKDSTTESSPHNADVEAEEWHVYLGCVTGEQGANRFVWAAGRSCVVYGSENNSVPDLGATVNVSIARLTGRVSGSLYRVIKWEAVDEGEQLPSFGKARIGHGMVTIRICIPSTGRVEWINNKQVNVYSHPFFGHIADDRNIIHKNSSYCAYEVEIRKSVVVNNTTVFLVFSCIGGASKESLCSETASLPLNSKSSRSEGMSCVRSVGGAKPEKSGVSSPPITRSEQELPYLGLVGCLDDSGGYVYSKDLPRDARFRIENLPSCSNPHYWVGKWVRFGLRIARLKSSYVMPYVEGVMEVTEPPVDTRLQAKVPEIRVECIWNGSLSSDGRAELWNEDIGHVVDYHGIMNWLPHGVYGMWLVRHQRTEHRARWKISIYETNPEKIRQVQEASSSMDDAEALEMRRETEREREEKRDVEQTARGQAAPQRMKQSVFDTRGAGAASGGGGGGTGSAAGGGEAHSLLMEMLGVEVVREAMEKAHGDLYDRVLEYAFGAT